MFYKMGFIESSDKSLQLSVESLRIPFLHKSIVSIINRSRIVPFLDPNDSIQRDSILSITKKSLLTICFDVEQSYQRIIDIEGHSSKLFLLYDGFLLTSLDQNIALRPAKRRDLKRRKKLLSETGEMGYLLSTKQNIDKIKFDRFFSLLELSYDQGRVNTRWGIKKNKGLLEKILNLQDALLFEMTINNKPIAFAYCKIMSNNRLVYMIATYDKDYAKFSPGMLLILYIMDYCASKNMVLDLGKGAQDYKKHFDSKTYSLYSIFIFDNNIGKLILKPIKLLLNLFIFIQRRNNKIIDYKSQKFKQ